MAKSLEETDIDLSIVTPVYDCRDELCKLVERASAALKGIAKTFEIILVNDGCLNASWEEILILAEKHHFVRGIKLSRNFGQHEAITAGLHEARGTWIVVMDCDLQDSPEEIPRLYQKALEGYDIVYAKRVTRQDSWIKRKRSHLFSAILGYMTDTKLDSSIANFGIYHKKVIDAVLSMGESLRFFPAMVRWVGFTSTKIDVEHFERPSGKSSYSLNQLFDLALNVVISFSDKPLRIMFQVGLIISVVSGISAFFIFLRAIITDNSVPGWGSMIVSLWFIGGVIIMMIGMVGVYVGKAFSETKNRPIYIIEKRT